MEIESKKIFNSLNEEQKMILHTFIKVIEKNDYRCCWLCGKTENGTLPIIENGKIDNSKIKTEKTNLYYVELTMEDIPLKLIICKECLEKLKNDKDTTITKTIRL